MEARWKRQTAAKRSSSEGPIAHRADCATDGCRPQHLLAPYKQEVAPFEPGTAHPQDPLPKRNLCHSGTSAIALPDDASGMWLWKR